MADNCKRCNDHLDSIRGENFLARSVLLACEETPCFMELVKGKFKILQLFYFIFLQMTQRVSHCLKADIQRVMKEIFSPDLNDITAWKWTSVQYFDSVMYFLRN